VTQFAVVSVSDSFSDAKSDANLRGISKARAELPTEILVELPEESNLFEIVDGCSDVDSMLTEAQMQLIDGLDFSRTKLARIVSRLADDASDMFFWYGNEGSDLVVTRSPENLLDQLEIAARSSQCEAYVRYKRL